MIDIDIVEQLVPNPTTMLVQLCSTLVLFLLMKKFLWKSVKAFLDARAEKMQSDLAESEQAKQEALADRKKAQEELEGASAKGEQIVEAAVKQAKDEKESILQEAGKQAEALQKKAQEQIENERQQMYDGMSKEMVEVAMTAVEKLVGTKDTTDLDRQAIEEFVKDASHD